MSTEGGWQDDMSHVAGCVIGAMVSSAIPPQTTRFPFAVLADQSTT
jgi:hypothetical protein